MTIALVVAALTLGAWAGLRRATRPLPAPAEVTRVTVPGTSGMSCRIDYGLLARVLVARRAQERET